MGVNYRKLWKILIDKNMKKTDLINKCGISSNVVARMGKNKYVSLESIKKICETFECNIEDVVEIEKGDRDV